MKIFFKYLKSFTYFEAFFLLLFCFYGYNPGYGNVITYWFNSLFFFDKKYLLGFLLWVLYLCIKKTIEFILVRYTVRIYFEKMKNEKEG
jgi:hypothetical protein